MKNCSFCGAENEDAAVFCEECGKSFYKKCDKCGAENKLTAKFCNKCGARFVAPNTICYTAIEKIKSSWIDKNSLSHDFDEGNGYIVLKDGISSIDGEIFNDCNGLTVLAIPNSVTEIKIHYWSTEKYKKILPRNVWNKLKEYFEPHTIYYEATEKIDMEWISDNSIFHEFANGKGIIKLKDDVTEIGDMAFYGYRGKGLVSIIIPDSVTSIGERAFDGCYRLTSVTIGRGVTNIGKNAFSGCHRLTTVNFNPTNCTTMGWYDDCWGKIYKVFDGCTSLAALNIGENVTNIPDRAFYGCKGLTSINIPYSVKVIGKGAFRDCSGLSSINIPDSVMEIGNGAFDGCNGLTSVYYAGSIEQWCAIKFGNGSSNPICNANNLYIDNNLVTKLVIPNTVTKIEPYAFYEATCLTSVTIGNSVSSIGESAFEDCCGLTTVTIGISVTNIGKNAFYGCSGLLSFTIPNTVVSIGDNAFYHVKNIVYQGVATSNTKVTKVTNDTVISYYSWGELTHNGFVEDNFVYSDESKKQLTGCSILATEVTIPNSVTGIEAYAFQGCNNLTSFLIPSSVTSIGPSAFLETGWYNNQSDGILYLDNWCIGYKGDRPTGDLTIVDGTLGIVNSAFENCSGLTTINIPDSVTKIGGRAFYGCNGLTSVLIGNSVKVIGWNAFSGCRGLTSINIPDSVTKIGGRAFYGCSGLMSIVIPDSVTEFGQKVFGNCSNLKSIKIDHSTWVYIFDGIAIEKVNYRLKSWEVVGNLIGYLKQS